MRRPSRSSLLACLAALVALPALAEPAPIEGHLFDALVGRTPDMTRPQLFERFGVSPPDESPLPFDVTAARFYDEVTYGLSLDESARGRLARDGLLLVDPPHHYSMPAALWALFTSDLPLLVTSDSVLDAMHRSFDDILAELETQALRPMIIGVLERTREAADAMARQDPSLAESADDVDLYLTVALNLMKAEPRTGTLKIPPRRAPAKAVQRVLGKVKSLALESGPGTTLGGARRVDWSQFKPRGHYEKSGKLRRYFRAMMWLGRADTGFEIGRARQLRAAALLSHAARTSGALETLGSAKAVIDLFVGRSDELTPFQLADLMDRMKLTPAALAEASERTRLTEQLAASGMGTQRIRSQVVLADPNRPRGTAPPDLFQMFGQRFVIDSFVLSKVVFDDIAYQGDKPHRGMPTGLDVMAALGSDLALWLSKAELDRWHYSTSMAALRDVIAAYTDEHWQDSLYMLWLDALRTLHTLPEGHVPAVMKRGSWGRKMLQTQLASWAQLRHDTLLYARQSYSGSRGCVYPAGYVEPYPALYASLGRFARTAAERLDGLKGLGRRQRYPKRAAAYFRGFAGHMGTLETLARKELAAEPFSEAEELFLRDTIEVTRGGGSGRPPKWNGWYLDLVYVPEGEPPASAHRWKPTIADVHTDPDAGQVLEVGTGDVHFVVAAIDNAGDTALYVGPTFTYYSFRQPASNRLTDLQWTRRLSGSEVPPRPDWIRPLVVEGKARRPQR